MKMRVQDPGGGGAGGIFFISGEANGYQIHGGYQNIGESVKLQDLIWPL